MPAYICSETRLPKFGSCRRPGRCATNATMPPNTHPTPNIKENQLENISPRNSYFADTTHIKRRQYHKSGLIAGVVLIIKSSNTRKIIPPQINRPNPQRKPKNEPTRSSGVAVSTKRFPPNGSCLTSYITTITGKLSKLPLRRWYFGPNSFGRGWRHHECPRPFSKHAFPFSKHTFPFS